MKTKLKYVIRAILPVVLICQYLTAQTVVTGGSYLKINAGSNLVSTQNLTIQNGGVLFVNGNLNLKRNMVYQNTGTDFIGNGSLEFSGTVNQNLIGDESVNYVRMNNPAGLTLGGPLDIYNTLTLIAGKVILGDYNLTIRSATPFAGTPGPSAMVVPEGEGKLAVVVQNGFTGNVMFPVGDNSGTIEYSPVTLTFHQSHTGNGGEVALNLVNQKYPDPGITGNYLNRYWNLSASNFDFYQCNATFQYLPADVTGSEDLLSATRVNPAPWITYDMSNLLTHQLSVANIPLSGSFTGLKTSTTPANTQLENIFLCEQCNGDTTCYDATQVLRVAGNGTWFNVIDAGHATLIAGQKVLLLPGTHVWQGGYLHAYITTDGSYCGSEPNPLVSSLVSGPDALKSGPDPVGISATETGVSVYPNPAKGLFTVALTGAGNDAMTRVEILTGSGISVLREEIPGEQKRQFSLAGFMPGLYVVKVNTQNQVKTVKIIKN